MRHTPAVMIARYGDEQRLAFGQVAQVYDRVRPSYPPVVIDAVLDFAGVRYDGRILEVGAGTGKATTLLADRGLAVLALEPDPAMAAVARMNCAGYPAARSSRAISRSGRSASGLPRSSARRPGIGWRPSCATSRRTRRSLRRSAGGDLDVSRLGALPAQNVAERHLSDHRTAAGARFPMHPDSTADPAGRRLPARTSRRRSIHRRADPDLRVGARVRRRRLRDAAQHPSGPDPA